VSYLFERLSTRSKTTADTPTMIATYTPMKWLIITIARANSPPTTQDCIVHNLMALWAHDEHALITQNYTATRDRERGLVHLKGGLPDQPSPPPRRIAMRMVYGIPARITTPTALPKEL